MQSGVSVEYGLDITPRTLGALCDEDMTGLLCQETFDTLDLFNHR